jgi:predicted phosphohydrolase
MRLFAIADLHLSHARAKPMDVFDPAWKNHAQRIESNWRAAVRDDDAVMVAGDLSWAMRLDDARPDLVWLDSLPGRKVLIRGNHDYWWSTLRKIQQAAGPSLTFLQHNALKLGRYVVCGARLWSAPNAGWPSWTEDEDVAKDEKLWQRELIRLGLSLDDARDQAGTKVAMVHFPPVGQSGEPTEASRMLEDAGVEACVFGHLHGGEIPWKDQVIRGIRYFLVSCDQIGFAPRLVLE